MHQGVPLAAHPVRRAFRRIEREEGVHGNHPTAESLRTALDLFYALPEPVQRRALNGWRPCPRRPSPGDILRMFEKLLVRRVVEIDYSPSSGKVSANGDFELEDRTNAVRVIVQEGTPRDQVVAELAAIVSRVLTDWDAFVEMLPGGYGEPASAA